MLCIFCQIAKKEIQSQIIYENDASLTILDIHPLSPGHTMVIPRFHAETILDLPDNQIEPLFKAVKEITHKIKNALSPDGFTIGINHGKNAGQAIDHLHIHVIPRYKGDGGASIHEIVKNPPKEESLDTIKAKILNTTNN